MSAALDLDRYAVDPVALILEQFVLEHGQPYVATVEPWQADYFRAAFASLDGYRPKHRLVYSERRRGESKTEDMAAIALADLLQGPRHHQSFAVAADEDQARIVVESVAGFKLRSPILASVQLNRNVVRNLATGSELRVMSSDDRTAYGIRPRRVYFDELSLQLDERLWTSTWSSIGKRPSAQMVAVSMAGWDFSSLGWRIRELARTTEAYFFQTREGSELAPWLSAEDMAEQQRTLHPAEFSRFWECRWVEPKGSWITREMFEAAEVGKEAYGGPGPAFGFVDVGLVHDATAVAVVHLDGERVVLDTLRTLQGSRSEPVELAVLEGLVEALTASHGVRRWVFEAPQAVASVQRLAARLSHVQIEARYPTADTQARLFGGLYQLFASKRLTLFPHDQLKREALNLVTRTVGGRIKVVDSGSIHQDHVIAVGGAAELAVTSLEARKPWFGVVDAPAAVSRERKAAEARWQLIPTHADGWT